MLIRSSIRALKMDTGYNSKHVLSVELRFPEGERYSTDRRAALVRELRTRLSAMPGVAAMTSARAPDSAGGLRTAAVSVNGEKPSPQNTLAILYYTYIQTNYFQTLKIPLLFGRGFETQTGQPEDSVILSESAAQILWPGQNPIGRKLRMTHGWAVPGESRHSSRRAGVRGGRRGPRYAGSPDEWQRCGADLYSDARRPSFRTYPILIRTQSVPTQLVSAIGPIILSIDPNLTAYIVHSRRDASPDCSPSLRQAYRRRSASSDRDTWASAGFYGHLRHCKLYRCAAHARGWHSDGSRRRESGTSLA